MKPRTQNQSLRNRFRNLSIRWSLFGLVLTILIVVPTVFAVVRHSSERQVEVMATALGRAFRPLILKDQIRDAQLQMENVAKLKSDESVTVLDGEFKPIYLEKLGDTTPAHCLTPNLPCWLGTRVSISAPVYFDDDTKRELYGYLVLTVKPSVDWYEIFVIVLGGGLVFIFQVYGFYSSLKGESYRIERVLSGWKKRIDNPKLLESEDAENRLFDEFVPLNQSVKNLHSKISDLESAAAKSAATKAQVDIVRGIGHDLKTPLSQLAKYFSLFVASTNETKTVNDKYVDRIEDTMKLMGSLIRQVTNLGRKSEISSKTNLTLWLTAYCKELRSDSEILKNEIKVSFVCFEQEYIHAAIDETDLFRLVDNLIRNAVEAFPDKPQGQNQLTLSLRPSARGPIIEVSDNGSGIPKSVQDRIFDLDFTTKKTRGTGLGLGIVKKICVDIGLKLNFSSDALVGTTFQIEFPHGAKEFSESVLRGEVNI